MCRSGIECVWRYVSYGTWDYGNVKVVDYDEKGTEKIIDAVAGVQANAKLNEELKYKKNIRNIKNIIYLQGYSIK